MLPCSSATCSSSCSFWALFSCNICRREDISDTRCVTCWKETTRVQQHTVSSSFLTLKPKRRIADNQRRTKKFTKHFILWRFLPTTSQGGRRRISNFLFWRQNLVVRPFTWIFLSRGTFIWLASQAGISFQFSLWLIYLRSYQPKGNTWSLAHTLKS